MPARIDMTSQQIPALAIAGVVVAFLAAVTLYNGPSVIAAPTDVFILIGGAYRMTLGQLPHIDFDNPIGALTYGLVAAGMALGGPDSLGLSWGAVLLMAISTAWAGWVAFTRLEPWLACAFVVFIALLCVATRPLGYDPTNHSYAMLYNRIGWVFLCILAIQAFIAPKGYTQRQDLLDAASLGALVAVLFYTKVTFALFGAAAIVLALVARPGLQRGVSLLAMALGFVLTAALIWLGTGAAPLAYLQDIAAAGDVQSPEGRLRLLATAIKFAIVPLGFLSIAWLALVGPRILSDRTFGAETLMITLQFAFFCGAGLVLTTGNTGENGEVPFYVMAGLLLLHHRAVALDDRFRRRIVIGGAAVTAALALFIGGRDALSIADTTAMRGYRIEQAPASQRIDAPRLHNFVVPHTSEHPTQFWRAAVMPSKINEGLALLRAHVAPDSRLMVFALTDPFSFPLSLEPTTGVPLWWDRNLSYNLETHPPAERVFADVTHVMIPQLGPGDDGCCEHVVADMEQMYGPYVAANFVEAGRSTNWVLLRRR
ncbi:MAG: hypothetical protein K2X34_08060 [Hyphomonadaceae bacterium]|nr:hypothetical protein [Hyphomonadaceae bacterium]